MIAANAKVGVAYTNMFPRLALTGGFGTESTSLSSLLKSPYAVMEGALLTPIFGWGKNRAALKAKKAAYEAEVHNYEKSVLQAFKETRNAIVNFNKIKEVYELRANLNVRRRAIWTLRSFNTSTVSSIIWMCWMPNVDTLTHR